MKVKNQMVLRTNSSTAVVVPNTSTQTTFIPPSIQIIKLGVHGRLWSRERTRGIKHLGQRLLGISKLKMLDLGETFLSNFITKSNSILETNLSKTASLGSRVTKVERSLKMWEIHIMDKTQIPNTFREQTCMNIHHTILQEAKIKLHQLTSTLEHNKAMICRWLPQPR